MPFALDASIALAWAFPDEQSPVADAALERLDTGDGVVPALWWFEVRNALIAGERRQRLDQAATAEFLRRLSSLPIAIDRTPDEGMLLNLAMLALRPPWTIGGRRGPGWGKAAPPAPTSPSPSLMRWVPSLSPLKGGEGFCVCAHEILLSSGSFATAGPSRHAVTASALSAAGDNSASRGSTSRLNRVRLATVSWWLMWPPCPMIKRCEKPPT